MRACGWECGARTCGGRTLHTCLSNVRQEWDKDDGSSLEDKVKSLHQHDVPAVLVSVKLVGLQAGSVESGGFAVDDRLLRRHLQSVARDRMHQLHALHTEFRADEPHAGGPSTTDHSHDFFVKRKFSFVVSHASRCARGCAHLVCECVRGWVGVNQVRGCAVIGRSHGKSCPLFATLSSSNRSTSYVTC